MLFDRVTDLPASQRCVWDRCVHPSGAFREFTRDDVEQSIVQRFEETARDYADRLAVKTKEHVLTYDQLNRMANRVGRCIQQTGQRLGEPIALLLANDAPFMACVMGVLKTGNPCVVLDPTHPAARTRFILDDSLASLIIADDQNLTLAREICGQRPVIRVEEIPTNQLSDQNLGMTVSPDAVAVIVYTSGSTGGPKGVIATHRSELHGLMNTVNAYHICSEDRLAQLSSPSTAQGIRALWRAFLTGASAHPFNVRNEGLAGLAEWLRVERITILLVGVPTFRAFIGTLSPGQTCPDIRLVRLASDRVTKGDVDSFRAHFAPTCVLINALSCSEVPLIRTYFVDHDTPLETDVPVGYPLDDVDVLLLDDEGNDVGYDEVGEITVGSRHLCPGYWRRPDLTDEKFTADPRGGDRRMLRTGDLGRMSEDGCLVHLGRKDARVKIRGFSVETAEIETRLLEHAGIREAFVCTRDVDGDKKLVAYVVPANRPSPTIAELRTFLGEDLPDYMTPSEFVTLDTLPLNVGGKVDREKLPVPGSERPTLPSEFVAPRTEIEKRLARIWSEVLGREEIGIYDNFFELGGHSLTGARILARVLDVFHVRISVREFFKFPTLAAMVEFLTGVREGAQQGIAPVIVSSGRNGPLPLSFAQQRLWFLNQLEPGNPFYNVPNTLVFKGVLNVAVLEAGLNEIARRHESLRTTFSVVDGEPVQIIHTDTRVVVRRVDLKGLAAGRQDAAVKLLMHELGHQPFDLSQGPLLRVTLLEITARENLLLYEMHHIISDGWSSGNLTRELGIVMTAFGEGKPSPLPNLPIQYADYAVWERGWLQGDVLEGHLAYWREHLTGAPAFLELPSDRPRPKVATFRGARYPWKLSARLTAALQELGQREGTTVFTILLAAFNVLLYRLTGQEDLVLGMNSANRTRLEVEELIGFFVNLLPLRTQVKGAMPFRELLRAVRHNSLAVYEHQEMPLEKIVKDQRPVRDLSHEPLFQVVFDMANPVVPMDLPGLTVERVPRRLSVAQYDLTLHAAEGREAIELAMEYSTELFDEVRIKGMLRCYGALLESIVAKPGGLVSHLSILTEAERHQLLVEWNDTAANYPKDRCLHELFEEQVERTPDAAVVSCEDEQVTYRELNRRANQLAHHLQRVGVGPDVLVGLMMERSVAMMVVIFGIFKAGGAYVPLDPDYPEQRRTSMIANSAITILITDAAGNVDRTPNPEPRLPVLVLDEHWPAVAQQSCDELPVRAGPRNLSYVIYTSGSTGVPKGAMIEHRGMINHLCVKIAELGLTGTDVVAQTASPCFDISVWQFLAACLVGARVHILGDDVAFNAPGLPTALTEYGVTIFETVPSLLGAMLPHTKPPGPDAIRILLVTGEAVPPELCRQWLGAYPDIPLVNAYGPTECSDDVTHHLLHVPPMQDAVHVPIGRPLANTQLYITSRDLQPQPIAVPGELWVGGAGVGRGYFRDGAKTAATFMPDSFSTCRGGRLYRTGDLVRYLSEGHIVFLGRLDHQVKVRGFRIELGEIETALRKHSAIKEAVVVARCAPTADRRETEGEHSRDPELRTPNTDYLVAYVVGGTDPPPGASELRQHLAQILPEYMLPGVFVTLEALPLNANGKIDRNALPEPEVAQRTLPEAFVAPRTETENTLAVMWCEVLELDRVGVHDNFFELGGHSLLAAHVISRVHETLGVELRLRALFEAPTIAGLAELIVTMHLAATGEAVQQSDDRDTEDETF